MNAPALNRSVCISSYPRTSISCIWHSTELCKTGIKYFHCFLIVTGLSGSRYSSPWTTCLIAPQHVGQDVSLRLGMAQPRLISDFGGLRFFRNSISPANFDQEIHNLLIIQLLP